MVVERDARHRSWGLTADRGTISWMQLQEHMNADTRMQTQRDKDWVHKGVY